jgi:hypothetical protein
MTTNRVKSIDSAVQPPIQLAIQYHDLNCDQRLGTYKNRLKHIPDEELADRAELMSTLIISPLIKLKLTAEKPNGRQIRNTVTYARALAKSENTKATLDHPITVAETTSTLTESMKESTRSQRSRNELAYEEKR